MKKFLTLALFLLFLTFPLIAQQTQKRFTPKEGMISIMGTFKEFIGDRLTLAECPEVNFYLITPQAKKKALYTTAKYVILYGYKKSPTLFEVHYIEEAPSLYKIFEKSFEQLSQKASSSKDDWMILGEWALKKAGDGDQKLLEGTKRCFAKGLTLWEKSLSVNNPKDLPQWIELLKTYKLLNQAFKQAGRPSPEFSSSKILSIAKPLLKKYPQNRILIRIASDLNGGFVHGPRGLRKYRNFKREEGFILYSGPIAEYRDKWVGSSLHKLLEAAEVRLHKENMLRQQPQIYRKALNSGYPAIGMTRREATQAIGFPAKVMRISLQKPLSSEGLLSTTYEIWVYGDGCKEYLCLENGEVFFFPDTFSIKKK